MAMDDHSEKAFNRCQLILLGDIELCYYSCWSSLSLYGTIKALTTSADQRAVFVEFECEHAPLLVLKCFEYKRANKHVSMSDNVVTVIPECSANNFIVLPDVPCSLSTEAIQKHFSAGAHEIAVHRPEPAEKTSTVVIEMKGMDFSLIPKEFAITDDEIQHKLIIVPHLQMLSNTENVFDNEGCFYCNVAQFRNSVRFEDRERRIDSLNSWIGDFKLTKFWATIFDGYYRWCLQRFYNRTKGTDLDVIATMARASALMNKSDLLTWTLRHLEKALRGRPVAQVLIFGNGNFDRPMDHSGHGAFQLALALSVAESYPSAPVNFQEPEMTNHECTWLEQRGIIVRKTRSMSQTGCRLVFFFHSPINLMEQLLAREIESGSADSLILMGNDYTVDTDEKFNEVENVTWRTYPVAREFGKKAKKFAIPYFAHDPLAFYDEAILHLPEGEKLTDPGKQQCTIL